MKCAVEIIQMPGKRKNENGKFFEDFIRRIIETEGYHITQNLRFTGTEIDLMGKHKTRSESVYVECKAKQDVNSGEIKSFLFSVLTDKKADHGYFVHTNELSG
jgi:Holliday junction resolvase-like predicted endonuclease